MASQTNEQKIKQALHLIKIHIETANTDHNRDLHKAVQLIVDVTRDAGILSNR